MYLWTPESLFNFSVYVVKLLWLLRRVYFSCYKINVILHQKYKKIYMGCFTVVQKSKYGLGGKNCLSVWVTRTVYRFGRQELFIGLGDKNCLSVWVAVKILI